MKQYQTWIAAVVVYAVLAPFAVRAAENEKLNRDVETAVAAFKKADSSIAKLFDTAHGYAVFPNVGKGGFLIGASHGGGLVYERKKLVGTATLTQVSVGAQIGGQAMSEIIFFENEETLERFKANLFAMSAQVGAVAAAEGVSQNAKYVDGVMVFTLAKQGLMAEASVGGQKFKFKPRAD